MENQNKFRNLLGSPGKSILKISLPMMAGMMANIAYNLADAIWVAGLGPQALAAIGIFFPVFFVIVSLASGISVGGSSALSRSIGARKLDRAGRIASTTILLSSAVGFLLTLPGFIFLKNIFEIMGVKKEVLSLSVEYGRIMLLGGCIIFYNHAVNGIFRGEGNSKYAMYGMLIGAGLNIALDPIFIYLLHLKVKGAAVASVITLAVTAAVFTVWLFVKRITHTCLKKPDFSQNIIYEILKVGIPSSLSQFLQSIFALVMNILILKVAGTKGIAVFTSGWRIITIGVTFCIALAMGTTAVTAAAYGAKDFLKLKKAYLKGIKIGTVVELILAILIFLSAPFLAKLFTYSTEGKPLHDMITHFLKTMTVFLIFVPAGMLSVATLQGMGKGLVAFLLSTNRTIILVVPLAYFFGVQLHYGLEGIWKGIILGTLLSSIIAFATTYTLIRKLYVKAQQSDSTQ